MIGIFEKLFGSNEKEVTSRDLKVALMGVKRNRRKKQMELRKLARKQSEMIEQIKQARKNGNDLEVDILWEELRQLRIDTAYSRREAKILNLESIGLTRYIRGLERLEKANDKSRIKDLLDKVRTSGLDELLRGNEVDEMAYLDALTATMDEVSLDIEGFEAMEEEDPEKAKMLKEIDLIIEAENEGDIETAFEREEKLKEEMEEMTEEAGL